MRTKLSSYLDPRASEEVDILFPTERTWGFLRILHENGGSCRGQTIHQVLRDPSVFRKQLLYGLSKRLFDGVTVRRVTDEWRAHTAVFPYESYGEEDLLEYMDIWALSIKHSVKAAVTRAVQGILYRYVSDEDYCLYVDWLSTLGVVPIQDAADTAQREKDRAAFLNDAILGALGSSPLANEIVAANRAALDAVILSLTSHAVPNSRDVIVERSRKRGDFRGRLGQARLRVYAHCEPLAYEGGRLTYTTPVAHLYAEVRRHAALCRHQKICQLLNTHPVKTVTTSRHELSSKRIVELMEKHDKGSDAKKSIVKFLLNLSESKSKIGIEDSVESFIQDLTPSIMLDQSKLLPQRAQAPARPPYLAPGAHDYAESADRDVRDLFKRQIIKCLEEQIESQMEEIQELKLLNQTWERKAEELRGVVARYGHDAARAGLDAADDDLDGVPVAEAVRRVRAVPFDGVSVDDNRVVANSFFSQFIPDTDRSEERLGLLWEQEYMRTFKLRRNVTNQGDEESITYSNYTIDRVLTPFFYNVLELPYLEPVSEEYLFLSPDELVEAAYESSRLKQYVRFVCVRELARVRRLAASAAAARVAGEAAAPYQKPQEQHRGGQQRPQQHQPPHRRDGGGGATTSLPPSAPGAANAAVASKLDRLRSSRNVQRADDPRPYGTS